MRMEHTRLAVVFGVLLIVAYFWPCEGCRRGGGNGGGGEESQEEEDDSDRKTLSWISSVEKNGACGNEIDVTVDIECKTAFSRQPSDSELTRLCQLIKDGIRQYWSRSLTKDGTTWKVNVNAREVSSGSRKNIVIKTYDKEPFVGFTARSHNSGILSMTMKYLQYQGRPDESFKLTAGHEIGHSFLQAAKGLRYSWTHKGTSTLFGKILEGVEQFPAYPAEIDLMKYYPGSWPYDVFTRSIAAEDDVKLLIEVADTTRQDPC